MWWKLIVTTSVHSYINVSQFSSIWNCQTELSSTGKLKGLQIYMNIWNQFWCCGFCWTSEEYKVVYNNLYSFQRLNLGKRMHYFGWHCIYSADLNLWANHERLLLMLKPNNCSSIFLIIFERPWKRYKNDDLHNRFTMHLKSTIGEMGG